MEFTKMHGLGNDFIIINTLETGEFEDRQLAIRLCDRQLGIGADGILLVCPSEQADFKMRLINADGSEAEMCGNGIRCFAKYLYDHALLKEETYTIETLAGIMKPSLQINGDRAELIKVDMGEPSLERSTIPMLGTGTRVLNEPLQIGGATYYLTSLLMGVPHTMIFTDDVTKVPLTELGPAIERNAVFPRRTNVNFVEVINQHELKVRTWERGAGATLACGTGSCASVIAAHLNQKTTRQVTVHLQVGDLFINWAEDNHVYMTGSATEVFTGRLAL